MAIFEFSSFNQIYSYQTVLKRMIQTQKSSDKLSFNKFLWTFDIKLAQKIQNIWVLKSILSWVEFEFWHQTQKNSKFFNFLVLRFRVELCIGLLSNTYITDNCKVVEQLSRTSHYQEFDSRESQKIRMLDGCDKTTF